MAYRNVYYDNKTSKIHFFGYNSDGDRLDTVEIFHPFILIKSPNEKKFDAIGTDGVPLLRKNFKNEWERRSFLKEHPNKKVYYNLPATQQFLLEKFSDKDIRDLTQYPLRTFFYDIEVIADEFPDPKEAKFPITSITIWDSETRKFYVWGIKQYNQWTCKDHLEDIEPEEIVYEYCLTEQLLLKKFLRFWRSNFPDLIVGYNSYSFDMPYIVNRLNYVFDKEDKASELSPVGSIIGREQENKFKQKYIEYTLGGISHIDYMVLYRTYTPGERESDALDYICNEEIGKGKLDYDDLSLKELSEIDWNKFINYNIWDVKLMILLDEQKGYLDVAKFSAFSGLCNLDKAFGKTSIITGVLAKRSLQIGKYIPTQTDGVRDKIPGGYVKQPKEGLYEDVISFDANSLYPSIMITLNISPETKVGKILKIDDDEIELYIFPKKAKLTLSKDKFHNILKEKEWSVSACGIIFNQKQKGIAADFVDDLYQKRKAVKDEMLGLEIQLNKMDATDPEYKKIQFKSRQLDTEQYLYKILLNSTYGAFANRFFALYDLDCAKSITTTGQAMIKQSEKIVNDFLVKEWNLSETDRVVGMDTDSLLMSIKDINTTYNFKLVDSNGDLTKEFIDVETKISNNLNYEIDKWAKEKLNSKDPRFFFKRESVCPKAIWTGKKHYILYLVNKEGKKMDKFKYSGMAIAKSVWSEQVKDISKKVVKIIMQEKDKKKADNLVYKAFEEYKNIPIIDIAERSSIKVLDKWEKLHDGLDVSKGATRHAKYSIYYNELIKQLGLSNKYKKIENGSRLKLVYLKDNKYNLEGIAFQSEFPKEFNLEVDYERMFFKGVLKSLTPIYDALKWKIPDPKRQYETTFDEFFDGN